MFIKFNWELLANYSSSVNLAVKDTGKGLPAYFQYFPANFHLFLLIFNLVKL